MQGRHRSTMRLAVGRRLHAGQPLAHDQRERILERRVGTCRDVRIACALEAIVEHGVEIGGDALHAAASRSPRRGPVRRRRRRRAPSRVAAAAAMHLAVVAGEPQRHGVGMAARGSPRRARRRGAAARAAAPRRRRRSGSGSAAPAQGDFEAGSSWRCARMQPATARLKGSCGAFHFRRRLDVRSGQGGFGLFRSSRHWSRSPAIPRRSSAGRTRRPAGAQARRIY